jgi:iron complex transport system substrate-binding protein
LIDRRALIAGLSAALIAPRRASAETVSDAAGRTVPVPAKVSRVFPAGPPAAILLYTLAPDLLIGWPRANRPEECAYMLPEICTRPEIGRITGRGNTANLETVLALKPDLILDVGSTSATFVSLADRVQEQTGIPYALLDGRFAGIAKTYRSLGELIGRPEDAEKLARYTEDTLKTILSRVEPIAVSERPRVYYARGPRGLATGLGGSINVETIELIGRNGRNARRSPANVSIEQFWSESGGRHHRSGVRRNGDPSWASVKAARENRGASVTQDAVRLGGFSTIREPPDRALVARQNSLSGAFSGRSACADAGLLFPFLSCGADRSANRPCTCGQGLIAFPG